MVHRAWTRHVIQLNMKIILLEGVTSLNVHAQESENRYPCLSAANPVTPACRKIKNNLTSIKRNAAARPKGGGLAKIFWSTNRMTIIFLRTQRTGKKTPFRYLEHYLLTHRKIFSRFWKKNSGVFGHFLAYFASEISKIHNFAKKSFFEVKNFFFRIFRSETIETIQRGSCRCLSVLTTLFLDAQRWL